MTNADRTEVYDIECYAGLFLYIGYDIDTNIIYEFEISEFRNDLYALVKHLQDSKIKYGVAFNSISYDAQVLQYILENYHRWADKLNMEIVTLIKKFSNKTIDDSKYELWPTYREEQFEVNQVDLFKIHHFDNKARRCSLKWLEFSMEAENIEESPIEFDHYYFTEEEIDKCKHYCKTDVKNTALFLKFTRGDVEHEIYQGRDKIQDRLDVIEQMGFPTKAMNWSDVKIGDEINKKTYMELAGIEDPRKLYDLKKNARRKTKFTYGDCIPSYIEFKTPHFQEFHKRMLNVKVDLTKKVGYPFSYNGTSYIIAKGGIHSTEANRIVEPRENEKCEDADVGSQYPHYIIKNGLYPGHLGKHWLVGYTRTRDKRLVAKKSKDPRMKGVAEMLKLALNGGGYGKLNEKENWQYDPFIQFSCTIGNQFEILMLIEALEMKGIHCISANTDGIVCLYDRSKEKDYYDTCKWWEQKVGNSEHGKLEFAEYKLLVQTSVNHYLAIKADGTVKKKGSWTTEAELQKNKSRRIIPIALEKYYVDGIPVEETITKHKRIFDFLIGVKASRDYHYEGFASLEETDVYNRIIRYYVSKEGLKLIKVKNDDSEADGNEMTQCEAGHWKMTVLNEVDDMRFIKSYGINYDYYIQKANEIIANIGTGRKGKRKPPDKNQISMF
jgi:hypothetical protein